jgi:hypothetical protein
MQMPHADMALRYNPKVFLCTLIYGVSVCVMQGFRATLQRCDLSVEEHAAALAALEPPFAMLSVSDLVPPEKRDAFEAAGGDLL